MKITEIDSALSPRKLKKFKQLFDQPIPLSQAKEIIKPYFKDQDLFSILDNELEVNGDQDARDIIIEWLKQNVPELFDKEFEPAPPYESPITSHPDITGE